MEIFDVAIVGAGPAGTATAIRCSQAGLRVLIIEREAFPRHRPGESLHPGIEPLFESLGVMAQVNTLKILRYRGYWLQSGNASYYVPFGNDDDGEWQGFQIWRADLDQALLHKAMEAGCTVWQPCRAHHPLIQNNRVVGVATQKGNASTKFLIDASGSCHWLARHLDLPFSYASPRLILEYGYHKRATQDSPLSDPIFRIDSNCWVWEARVKEDLYHWCRLGLSPIILPVSLFRGSLTHTSSETVRRTDVTWRAVLAAAGAGYFIAGDAAAVLDPASSHGVLRAIMTGMACAQAITALSKHVQSETAILWEYSQWFTAWFQADTSALRQNYSRLGLSMI